MYGNYAKKRQKKKKKKKRKTPAFHSRFVKQTLPFRTIGQEDLIKKWAEQRLVGELYFFIFFFHFCETFGTLFRLLIYANKSMPILNWTYVALCIHIRGYLINEDL